MLSASAFSYVLAGSSLPGVLKSVCRKRDRLVQKRVDVNILKRDCAHQRNHNHVAYEVFHGAAEQLVSQADQSWDYPDSHRALEVAWQNLQLSRSRREELEERLRQATNELNVLEDELKEEEEALYFELQKLSSIPNDTSPDAGHESSSPRRSQQSESTTHDPPLLREYSEKNLQVSFLRAQLHEFQAEHREEVERRKLDKELNQPVAPSEKIFLERYFETLMAMYQEYYTAKHEVRALKLKCQELHLDIEDGEDNMSEMDALEASVVVDKQLIHFAAMNRSRYKGVNPLQVLLFGYTDSAARVRNWLTNVHQSWPNNDTHRTPTRNASVFDNSARFFGHVTRAEAVSTVSTTNLVRPEDRLLGSPDKFYTDLPGFDGSVLPRQTSFPGEAPKHRYSDPVLYQRPLETLYLPRLPRRRPESTH